MVDDKEKVDILFKAIAHGAYSDGTLSLVFVTLVAPVEGETIQEAQKGALINTSDCLRALDGMVKSGFTIRASVVKSDDHMFGTPIVIG